MLTAASSRFASESLPPSLDLPRDRLGLHEEQQVVAAAGFTIGSRHVETAERMHAHHGAGALAIEVEITNEELAARAFDLRVVFGVQRAGQSKLGIVCDRKRVLKVFGFDNG